MVEISDFNPISSLTARDDRDLMIASTLRQLAVDDIGLPIFEIEPVARDRQTNSPAREMAAEVLRRARRFGVGPDRNDLRQVAIGLIWLDRRGLTTGHLRQIERASH